MTDQTPMDRIREALTAVRALGPTLSRLDLSPNLWVALKTASLERQAHVAGALPLLSGVPVRVDRKLPPWARREHWTDGRVVTRYRLVTDPRVRQVAVTWQTRHAGPPEAHVTILTLMVKRFGWVPAQHPNHGGAVASTWKGQRVSPWSLLTADIRAAVARVNASEGIVGRYLGPRLISWGPVPHPPHPDWRITHVDGVEVPRWRERLSPGCTCGAPVGAPIIACPAHPSRQGSPDDAQPLDPDRPS